MTKWIKHLFATTAKPAKTIRILEVPQIPTPPWMETYAAGYIQGIKDGQRHLFHLIRIQGMSVADAEACMENFFTKLTAQKIAEQIELAKLDMVKQHARKENTE